MPIAESTPSLKAWIPIIFGGIKAMIIEQGRKCSFCVKEKKRFYFRRTRE